MLKIIKTLTLVLTLALMGCKGGDEGTSVPGEVPDIGDVQNLCTDMNADNIGLELPCQCSGAYTVSVDGRTCEAGSSSYSGWFGYDDALSPIDDSDISKAPPVGGIATDYEDNHIEITDKFLIGEVAANSIGVAIKDPSCSEVSGSVNYVAVLISTLDDNEPSVITIELTGINASLSKIGVSMGAGTSGTNQVVPITSPTGADCVDGVIAYTGGEEVAHNGDYVIYTSQNGLYVGVRETAGPTAYYYASSSFHGISTVSGDWRDSQLNIDASLLASYNNSGFQDANDGYVASIFGGTDGVLFSNEVGTSGVTSVLSAVSVSFNGGDGILSTLPYDRVLEDNGTGNKFYPTGADHFYFGIRQ